jgi:hypothetical protein|tara:strand:- start:401 stop:553 length:153 start_codon:yes stop_codon:yes gene_type:complete
MKFKTLQTLLKLQQQRAVAAKLKNKNKILTKTLIGVFILWLIVIIAMAQK